MAVFRSKTLNTGSRPDMGLKIEAILVVCGRRKQVRIMTQAMIGPKQTDYTVLVVRMDKPAVFIRD